MAITLEAIRAAGGIVHSDGNIFFRDISMLQGLAGAAPALEAPAAPACPYTGFAARYWTLGYQGHDCPPTTGPVSREAYDAGARAALAAAPQAPAAPSADERAAYVEFLAGKFPRTYSKEDAEHWWDNDHVSALTWQAARADAAAPAAPGIDQLLDALSQHDDPCEDIADALDRVRTLRAEADRLIRAENTRVDRMAHLSAGVLNVLRVALNRANMDYRATGFKPFEIDAAKTWVASAAPAAPAVDAPALGEWVATLEVDSEGASTTRPCPRARCRPAATRSISQPRHLLRLQWMRPATPPCWMPWSASASQSSPSLKAPGMRRSSAKTRPPWHAAADRLPARPSRKPWHRSKPARPTTQPRPRKAVNHEHDPFDRPMEGRGALHARQRDLDAGAPQQPLFPLHGNHGQERWGTTLLALQTCRRGRSAGSSQGGGIVSKTERLGHANALIEIISRHGRRFFRNRESGAIARLELDARGRLWWIDEYRGSRVYTGKVMGYPHRWRGFSHGGTLRSLVEALRGYILRGELLHPEYIAPSRIDPTNGDIWGYGDEAAAAVRAEAHALPLFQRPTGHKES